MHGLFKRLPRSVKLMWADMENESDNQNMEKIEKKRDAKEVLLRLAGAVSEQTLPKANPRQESPRPKIPRNTRRAKL